MNVPYPVGGFKIMTNLSYHNHLSKHSKQKSIAVIGLSELERAARISKLKGIRNDDDVWLVTMIKALTDSEKDRDC